MAFMWQTKLGLALTQEGGRGFVLRRLGPGAWSPPLFVVLSASEPAARCAPAPAAAATLRRKHRCRRIRARARCLPPPAPAAAGVGLSLGYSESESIAVLETPEAVAEFAQKQVEMGVGAKAALGDAGESLPGDQALVGPAHSPIAHPNRVFTVVASGLAVDLSISCERPAAGGGGLPSEPGVCCVACWCCWARAAQAQGACLAGLRVKQPPLLADALASPCCRASDRAPGTGQPRSVRQRPPHTQGECSRSGKAVGRQPRPRLRARQRAGREHACMQDRRLPSLLPSCLPCPRGCRTFWMAPRRRRPAWALSSCTARWQHSSEAWRHHRATAPTRLTDH